jgi:ribosomal protein S18 acetylase RimI-like enzyme
MLSINIEKVVTEGDMHQCIPLLSELCSSEGEDRLTSDLIIKNWHTTNQKADYSHYKVLLNEKIIATFGCQIIMGPTFFSQGLEISNLIVDRDYRKKGVASRIMKFCHNFAEDNGCEFIRLFRVKGNIPAEKLYKKLKYQHTADLMFFEFDE